MKYKLRRPAIGALLSVLFATSYNTSTSFAGTPNDLENYYGDHIKFIVGINATETNSPKVDVNYFDAAVEAIKKLDQAKTAQQQTPNDKDKQKLTQIATEETEKALKAFNNIEEGRSLIPIPAYTNMVVIGQDENHLMVKLESPKRGHLDNSLKDDVSYSIRKEKVYNSGLERTGTTYGALVVPYKYQLTGNKDLTGASSIGAYMGYRVESIDLLGIGFSLTPIAFGGASSISVHEASGTDSNVLGVSYGFGLITTLKHEFQVGAVIGWDHVGTSYNYQYNGKPWVALEIGYAFLQ